MESPVPAEDAALGRWKAIVADDMKPPAGTTAAALLPELEAYLGSPARRDGIGYEVLARWISTGVLADAEVRALAGRLLANLRGPLDEPDGVFRRSFSALVLASIAGRDAATPFLPDDEWRSILTAARDYAQRETDLRGHTGARGWAHAAAHTADLLAQLANSAALTEADRAVVLEAVAALVVRHHGALFAYGEDSRLAGAVIIAAKRGLAQPALEAWLATIKAPIVERWGRAFDAARFAAQRNARNLLVSLFAQASLLREPADGERRLLEMLRVTLTR